MPHRRRDRRQRHAEGARELVRPARVHLREIHRALRELLEEDEEILVVEVLMRQPGDAGQTGSHRQRYVCNGAGKVS